MEEMKGNHTFPPEWKHVCIIFIYFVVYVLVFNTVSFGGFTQRDPEDGRLIQLVSREGCENKL
jgi:hypothetical protein